MQLVSWAVLWAWLVAAPTSADDKFKCPAFTKLTSDEFVFSDPAQCDAYWTCRSGEASRSLCPDGLVFHPEKPKGEDPCDLMHNVPDKCKNRPDLQRPKPGDAHCPRQNGVYPSENPAECDIFYSCLNGVGSSTRCAEGLHFSQDIGTCVWARESGRTGCGVKEEEKPKSKKEEKPTEKPTEKPKPLANGFTCPGGSLGVHPALPHPTSCRLYYICTDGVTATEAGCTKGRVFNPVIQQCDSPPNVPGCEDFYDEKAKQRKEDLAESLGTDVGDKDFSKFLTLLKMSGVLKPEADLNAVLAADKKHRPGRPRRPTALKGGGRKRPAAGGRPRSRRPKRPPPPPVVEYDEDYEDYYDEDEEDDEDNLVEGGEEATPVASTLPPNLDKSPSRQNKFSSLIPRAKPVEEKTEAKAATDGRPEPKAFFTEGRPEAKVSSAEGRSEAKGSGSDGPVKADKAGNKPAVSPPVAKLEEHRGGGKEISLSAGEAENIFNSLFSAGGTIEVPSNAPVKGLRFAGSAGRPTENPAPPSPPTSDPPPPSSTLAVEATSATAKTLAVPLSGDGEPSGEPGRPVSRSSLFSRPAIRRPQVLVRPGEASQPAEEAGQPAEEAVSQPIALPAETETSPPDSTTPESRLAGAGRAGAQRFRPRFPTLARNPDSSATTPPPEDEPEETNETAEVTEVTVEATESTEVSLMKDAAETGRRKIFLSRPRKVDSTEGSRNTIAPANQDKESERSFPSTLSKSSAPLAAEDDEESPTQAKTTGQRPSLRPRRPLLLRAQASTEKSTSPSLETIATETSPVVVATTAPATSIATTLSATTGSQVSNNKMEELFHRTRPVAERLPFRPTALPEPTVATSSTAQPFAVATSPTALPVALQLNPVVEDADQEGKFPEDDIPQQAVATQRQAAGQETLEEEDRPILPKLTALPAVPASHLPAVPASHLPPALLASAFPALPASEGQAAHHPPLQPLARSRQLLISSLPPAASQTASFSEDSVLAVEAATESPPVKARPATSPSFFPPANTPSPSPAGVTVASAAATFAFPAVPAVPSRAVAAPTAVPFTAFGRQPPGSTPTPQPVFSRGLNHLFSSQTNQESSADSAHAAQQEAARAVIPDSRFGAAERPAPAVPFQFSASGFATPSVSGGQSAAATAGRSVPFSVFSPAAFNAITLPASTSSSFSSFSPPGLRSTGIQAPSLQSSSIQAPSLQSSSIQAPSLQSSRIQAPSLQSSFIQAQSLQSSSIQASSPQSSGLQANSQNSPVFQSTGFPQAIFPPQQNSLQSGGPQPSSFQSNGLQLSGVGQSSFPSSVESAAKLLARSPGSAFLQERFPSQLSVTSSPPLLASPGPVTTPPSFSALEEEVRRMVTARVRSQLSSVLPEAENEGDAIEMLRERVNTSQNKNRARG